MPASLPSTTAASIRLSLDGLAKSGNHVIKRIEVLQIKETKILDVQAAQARSQPGRTKNDITPVRRKVEDVTHGGTPDFEMVELLTVCENDGMICLLYTSPSPRDCS